MPHQKSPARARLHRPVSVRLQVRYRSPAELKANPRNPRRHSEKQVVQIAESIKAFQFISPIVINDTREVIIGHGRLLAAQKLGLREVPTIEVGHLSPHQLQALTIADNKLALNSDWDDRLLGEHFKELSEAGLDFSLDLLGFEVGEIDFTVSTFDRITVAGDDDVHEPDRRKPAVVRKGDLWALGSHRLFVGDATERGSYASLLGEERARMVFTDPPYNVPINGFVSGKGRTRHREFAMASGEMSPAQFQDFLSKVCKLLSAHTEEGSLHYLCMDWRHLDAVLAAGKGSYSELKNICVWVKHNAGMGSLYRSQHEFVLVYKQGSAPHRNNIELGKHGRHRSNVWQYAGANSGRRKGENPLDLHPTVKPTALVADAIQDCTKRADVVLDPFLGSGTTLIAAERTGRRCFGMEIDPPYADTIIRRWEALTGRSACRISSEAKRGRR